MNTNTEKTTIPTKGNIAIYLRYPKVPNDDSVIPQRINQMTSMVAESEGWNLTEVYLDIGIPESWEKPFPNFVRMQQDFKDGKFDILLTEPPHRVYRDLDQGMDYLIELRDFGPRVIFSNGQTMPELLAISVFRSTMKALALVEAMAVQEMDALRDEDNQEAEQPTMQF